MIIIYNVSGLLVGLAGILVGISASLATGSLAAGLLVMSAVWVVLGLWWRNNKRQDGAKRPFPSLFFIPLPFLAIVTVILGLLAISVDVRGSKESKDPRAQALNSAERSLRGMNSSGDQTLSTAVHQAISSAPLSGAIASSLNVYTDSTDSAVLVLVKVGNLKEFSTDARLALLHAVSNAVKSHATHQSKDVYVGVKGALSYGAILTPSETITNTTSSSPLLPYFADVQTAAPSSPFPPPASDNK